MAEPFVPFLPAANQGAEPAGAPAPANAPFTPLQSTLPQSQPPPREADSQPAAAQAEPAAPSPAHAHEPSVTCQRDGDRITQIQVRCKCGEVIELDCAY